MAESFRDSRSYSYGDDYSTYMQGVREEFKESQEPSPSFGELWDTSKQRNRVESAQENKPQLTTLVPEEDRLFSDEEAAEKFGLTTTQQEYDILAASRDPEDYQNRLRVIEKQRANSKVMASAGLKGVAVGFLVGATDLDLLPLYVGTGGFGAGARGLSLAARAGRSLFYGAAEGGAIESVLQEGDSQSDGRDLLITAATSGLVSSAFTVGGVGVSRALRGKEPETSHTQPDMQTENPTGFQNAMDLDEVIHRDGELLRQEVGLRDLEGKLNFTDIRNIDANKRLDDELVSASNNRMSKTERQATAKKLDEAKTTLEHSRVVNERWQATKRDTGGTQESRAKRYQREEPQRKNAANRLDAAERRVRNIEKRIEVDDVKRKAWADLSRVRQGQIPKEYKDMLKKFQEEAQKDANTPFRNLESEQVRAKAAQAKDKRAALEQAKAEQTAKRAESVQQAAEGGKARSGEQVDPQGEGTQTANDSAGAARVEGTGDEPELFDGSDTARMDEMTFDMIQTGESLGKNDFLRKAAGLGTRRGSSTYSDMMRSESQAVRGLTHTLMADPQAQHRGHNPVAVQSAAYEKRLLNIEGGREIEAQHEYAKELGINSWRATVGEGREMAEFDNKVVLEMKGIDQGSPAVKKAAEARQDVFREALVLNKRSGRAGWQAVEDDPSYWSVLYSNDKMLKAAAKTSRSDVIETMTGGYMNGRYKLGEQSARKVARAQYARTMQRNLVGDNAEQISLSRAEYQALKVELEESGVPTEKIQSYLDELDSKVEAETVSNRAKFSLEPDLTYSFNGIRMVDVISTNKRVADRYAQDSATGSALANKGFKTREELNALIGKINEENLNIAAETKTGSALEKARRQIARETDILYKTDKLLHLEALDEGTIAEVSRKTRKSTTLSLLQWNGYVPGAEAANAIGSFGVSAFKSFTPKDYFSFGMIRESEDLRGMYDVMGAYGQKEASIRDRSYSMDTMDEGSKSRMSRMFDNFIGSASEKSKLISFTRSMQHGNENMAMRSMQNHIIDIANGKKELKDRHRFELERSGISRETTDRMFESIRDNPEYGQNGKQIFSGKGLTEYELDEVSTGLNSLMSRQMQSNFVGETPAFMDREAGKFLTVFRAFGINSIEKQLAAGLRGDKIIFATKVALGTVMAYMGYSSRAWVKAQLEENPEKAYEKAMERKTVGMGVMNMSPHLGLFGMLGEAGYATGLGELDDDADTSYASRSGQRPLSLTGFLPQLSLGSRMATSARDSFKGTFDDDTDSLEALNDFRETLPLQNSAFIGTGLGIMHSLRDN